jgi:hypothetical protein
LHPVDSGTQAAHRRFKALPAVSEWSDFDDCHNLRFAFCSKAACAGRRNKHRAEILNKVFPACATVSYATPLNDAVTRVYDEAGNVIETHERAGDFKEW